MVDYIFNNNYFLRLLVIVKKLYNYIIGEENIESKNFEAANGYKLNLLQPKTLNEKTAWLKLYYLQDFYYKCCDKYMIHTYLKEKLGRDYAPDLYFATKNPSDLNYKNITKFPCIIKVSNGSGSNLIVNSKDQYPEAYLQQFFKKHIYISELHTLKTFEHQYETGKPYIVVEKLLQDKNNGIPNDYKFLFINGNLEFVYCSVDRLGANVRQVYDKDWNRLHFIWVENADDEKFKKFDGSKSIPKPKHFSEMLEISRELAMDFPLVRIDFYETEDDIYIGEITLHHGSGHDKFYPMEYDSFYGDKLELPERNR